VKRGILRRWVSEVSLRRWRRGQRRESVSYKLGLQKKMHKKGRIFLFSPMFLPAPLNSNFTLINNFRKTFSKIHIFLESIFQNGLNVVFYLFFSFIFKYFGFYSPKVNSFEKCFPKNQILSNAESENVLENIFRIDFGKYFSKFCNM
jgi:hypothetical protein